MEMIPWPPKPAMKVFSVIASPPPRARPPQGVLDFAQPVEGHHAAPTHSAASTGPICQFVGQGERTSTMLKPSPRIWPRMPS